MGLFGLKNKNRQMSNLINELESNPSIEAYAVPKPELKEINDFKEYAERTKGSVYKSFVTGKYTFLD